MSDAEGLMPHAQPSDDDASSPFWMLPTTDHEAASWIRVGKRQPQTATTIRAVIRTPDTDGAVPNGQHGTACESTIDLDEAIPPLWLPSSIDADDPHLGAILRLTSRMHPRATAPAVGHDGGHDANTAFGLVDADPFAP
jgi:hypothetical protein